MGPISFFQEPTLFFFFYLPSLIHSSSLVRNAGALFGTIAIPEKPKGRPGNADDSEEDERNAPTPDDNHLSTMLCVKSSGESRPANG